MEALNAAGAETMAAACGGAVVEEGPAFSRGSGVMCMCMVCVRVSEWLGWLQLVVAQPWRRVLRAAGGLGVVCMYVWEGG